MGIVNAYDSVKATSATAFKSGMDITFTGSGTTDGGLTFGGSFGANNSVAADAGAKGSVYISGAFGKISMGDVAGGDAASVGQLASVGFDGLGSTNSINYASDGFDLFGLPALAADSNTDSYDGYDFVTPANVALGDVVTSTVTFAASTKVTAGGPAKVLYTYSANGLTLNASASQLSNSATNSSSYGLGAAYTTGGLTVALGYGSNQFGFATTVSGTVGVVGSNITEDMGHLTGTVSNGTVTDTSLSATYVMGDTTVKAIYQDKQVDGTYQTAYFDPDSAIAIDKTDPAAVSATATSMGLSVVHVMGALSLTAFDVRTNLTSDMINTVKQDISVTRMGIGAAYDLGGGAKFKVGAVRVEAPNMTFDAGSYEAETDPSATLNTVSYSAYDVGVTFAF